MSELIKSRFVQRFMPNCIDTTSIVASVKAKMDARGEFPISVILLDRVKEQVKADITKDQLYFGSPGLGKSTVAKVRLLDPKYHTLYINGSKEGRIDVLRDKVDNFCSQSAISDDGLKQTKIVFIDEIDGISASFGDGFRAFMDTYQNHVLFLATANYISRIAPAIQSRFNPTINFNPLNEEESKELFDKYKKRLKGIWTGPAKMQVGGREVEGMLGRTCTDEAIHSLAVKTKQDIRSGIQTLQVLNDTVQGELTIDKIVVGLTTFKELFDFILSKDINEELLYKEIMIKYFDKAHDILAAVHSQFVDYILEKHPTFGKAVGSINIAAARYSQMAIQGVDPLLASKACLFEIAQIIAKYK